MWSRSKPFLGYSFVSLFALMVIFAAGVAAQSPNTGSIVVSVVDQNDAIVQGANVALVNTATGAARDVVSGSEGSATVAALPLMGEYKVTVTKTGFTPNEAGGLQLRAGETAMVKIKLAVSGGKTEVTVFGTTEGVRSDPQIGRLIESRQIDETPILSRKFSTVPLLNSAFRQGKGHGRPICKSNIFHYRRRLASCHNLHNRRCQQ